MKKLSVLLFLLALAGNCFAQAGGASQGAGLPAASTGAASTVVAVVAIAVAGVAAAATNNSTVTTPSHH